MSKHYNEEHLQTLSIMEGIRTRYSMYVDGIGTLALNKIDMEMVQNSLDEFSAGVCTTCDITHDTKTGYMCVEDDGRGIPIGKLEDVLTKMHAGGKFDNNAYKYHSGQNGAGLKIVNALSKKLIVQVWRPTYKDNNGVEVQAAYCKMEFSHGEKLSEIINNDNPNNHHGTKFEYWVDEEILTTHERDLNKFKSILEMLMFVNPGFTMNLTVDGKLTKYHETSYLQGYMKHFIKTKHIRPITDSLQIEADNGGPNGDIKLKAIFAYGMDDKRDASILSFVNNNQTISNGTHVSGLKSGLALALTNYMKVNNSIPNSCKNLSVTGSTISDNIATIVTLFHPSPTYNGQTKERLTSPDAEEFCKQVTYNYFTKWLTDNPKQAQKLIDRAIQTGKLNAELKNLKNEMNQVKESKNVFSNNGANPAKYVSCTSDKFEERELFIVEGDSAGGSLKKARDTETQALYMLRGKCTNVYSKNSLSAELLDIITILGMGHPNKKNYKNLKFNRIIITADADDDGKSIAVLVLGFFHKFYPELIENGHVYIALPPIKMLKTKTMKMFLTTEKDYDRTINNLAVETFDFYSSKSNKKLSKELFSTFINKTIGYTEFIDSFSIPLCLEPELLEHIVVNMQDLFDGNYKIFNDNGYNVVKREIKGVPTFEFDLGYKHMYLNIDTGFYDTVYIPILNKLKEIHLYGVYLIGIRSGKKYHGSIYNIVNVINGIFGKNVDITRLKGLGEMNYQDLEETAVNPKTRNIMQVTMNDVERAQMAVDIFMGPKNIDIKKRSFAGEDVFNLT